MKLIAEVLFEIILKNARIIYNDDLMYQYIEGYENILSNKLRAVYST